MTIHRRLRPIRLAFLVSPNDRKSLRAIFECNTCLWGGRFNGIVPVMRRTPAWWEEGPGRPSASEITRGYLAAFEPDYVVASRPDLAVGLGLDNGRLLQLEDLLSPARDHPIGHGLSVLDVYRDLHQKEFQFVRRHPLEVIRPIVADRRLSLSAAACFGAFPSTDPLKYFERAYREVFEAVERPVDGTKLLDVLLRAVGTPIRMGSSGVEVRRRGWMTEAAMFLIDAAEPRDLIDYWNLRALGWRIVPVPRQWADQLVEPCKRFVEQNNVPYRGNPALKHSTTLLKSRSLTEAEWEAFGSRIRGPGDQSLMLQHWYPRIWDEWARDKGHVVRCEISAEEGDIECTLEDRRVTCATLSPSFAERFGGNGRPRWANVVQVRDYRPGSDTALVLPPGMRDLERLLETVHRDTTSVTSEGIVVRCEYRDWSLRWRLPDSVAVFRAWLGERGLSAELSSTGRICGELIRTLGGPVGAEAIAHVDVLRLLDKMAHGLVETPAEDSEGSTKKRPVRSRMVSRKAWWDLLKRVNGGNSDRAGRHLDSLTRRGVLRVGLRLTCPTCGQANWYATGQIDEELTCERCVERFPFPASDPPAEAWFYRSQGPFSVENYAQGGYAVALALRFLTSTLHAQASWVPSVRIRDKGVEEVEVDFALWWRGSVLSEAEPTLILGECKSFGRFERRDVLRARALAERFPGAALVFATLRGGLGAKEKGGLAALARAGRRYLKAEKWRAPVLILTAHELMSDFGPPYCWQDAGGRFATFASTYRGVGELHELCDATQQLHLGMESYWEWHREYWDKRRRRRRVG